MSKDKPSVAGDVAIVAGTGAAALGVTATGTAVNSALQDAVGIEIQATLDKANGNKYFDLSTRSDAELKTFLDAHKDAAHQIASLLHVGATGNWIEVVTGLVVGLGGVGTGMWLNKRHQARKEAEGGTRNFADGRAALSHAERVEANRAEAESAPREKK